MGFALRRQGFAPDDHVHLKSKAVLALAHLPSAVLAGMGAEAFVSDEVGGPCAVYSDGALWRRTRDGAAASSGRDFGAYRMSLAIPLYTLPGKITVTGITIHNDIGANGYAPGQQVVLAGGAYTAAAILTVLTVDGGGGPLTASVTPGTYTVAPDAEQAPGSGFKFTVHTSATAFDDVYNTYTTQGLPKVSMVVITPDALINGAGGSGPGVIADPLIVAKIAALRAAGIQVYGYVHTNYRKRPVQDVIADINLFYQLYDIDGPFIDEVANDQFQYYSEIWNAVQLHARRELILNPGTNVVESYMQICTVLCCYEDTYANYLGFTTAAWMVNYDRRRFWHLVHTTDSLAHAQIAFDLARQRNVGNVFITDQPMPYPWSPLSAYHANLLTMLDATALTFALLDIPGNVGEFWPAEATVAGALVTSFNDRSALKQHETAAGAKRPTLVAGVLNALPVLRFAGAQRTQNDAFSRIQPYTIMCVYKMSSEDTYACGGTASGLYDSSAAHKAAYQAGLFRDGTIDNHNVFKLVTGVFSSATGVFELRINGVQSSILDPGGNSLVKSATGGLADDDTHLMTGDVAFKVQFNRALGPADLEAAEALIAEAFDLTLG